MCFDAAHVQHSFCTRSAPLFYERTTSAERVMNVGTTSDELGMHKEKRWCETGRDDVVNLARYAAQRVCKLITLDLRDAVFIIEHL